MDRTGPACLPATHNTTPIHQLASSLGARNTVSKSDHRPPAACLHGMGSGEPTPGPPLMLLADALPALCVLHKLDRSIDRSSDAPDAAIGHYLVTVELAEVKSFSYHTKRRRSLLSSRSLSGDDRSSGRF